MARNGRLRIDWTMADDTAMGLTPAWTARDFMLSDPRH